MHVTSVEKNIYFNDILNWYTALFQDNYDLETELYTC